MRPSRLPIAATLALAPTIALAQGAVAPMPLPRGTTGPADNLTVGGRPIQTIVGLSTYSMPPPSGSAATDAANFAAAQASGARRVLFQSGVYLVPPTGYPALRSNQCVSGQGSGATTLRITGPGTYAEGMLSAFGAQNFCLTGLTVDYAGFRAHPAPNMPVVAIRDGRNVRIDDVNITGFPYMGLSLNGAIDLVYDRGSVVRAAKPLDSTGAPVAPGVQNQCIVGSVSSSPISRVRFQDVACTGSGFDMSGSDVDYVRTSVDGFDFGFAYVTEYGSERHRFYDAVARNGRTNPATGMDVNQTVAGCFEIWSPGSVVDGARCDNVGGNGVSLGGKNSRVTNSTFTRLGMQVASSGISARYEEAGKYSADGAYIAGNTIVNSNGSGDGSNLTLPYAEPEAVVDLKITIGPNDFPAVPMTRKGASTAWAAPGMLITATSDQAYTHPAGTRQSPAARAVQGVRRGRDVILGATFRAADGSALPAGLRLSAAVDADNSVRFYLEDISGGSVGIPVPVGTYSARLITIN